MPKKDPINNQEFNPFSEPHEIPDPNNVGKTIPNPKYYQSNPADPNAYSYTPEAENILKAHFINNKGIVTNPSAGSGTGQQYNQNQLSALGFTKPVTGESGTTYQNPYTGTSFKAGYIQPQQTAQPTKNWTLNSKGYKIGNVAFQQIGQFTNPNTGLDWKAREAGLRGVFTNPDAFGGTAPPQADVDAYLKRISGNYADGGKVNKVVYNSKKEQENNSAKEIPYKKNQGSDIYKKQLYNALKDGGNDLGIKGFVNGGKIKGYDIGGIVDPNNTNPFLNTSYLNRLNSELGQNNSIVPPINNTSNQVNLQGQGVAGNLMLQNQQNAFQQNNQSQNTNQQTSNNATTPKPGLVSALGKSGLWSMAGNAAGTAVQSAIDKKKGGESISGDVAGNALRDAGTGAQIGANPELAAATGGLSVPAGAAIGLVEGGVRGFITGKKNRLQRTSLGAQSAEQDAINNQKNGINQTYSSSDQNANDYKSKFGIQGFANGGGIASIVKSGKPFLVTSYANGGNVSKEKKLDNIQRSKDYGGLTEKEYYEKYPNENAYKKEQVRNKIVNKESPYYAQSYANGGKVKGGTIEGPGTGKSDSIQAKVKEGSFVVPAENRGLALILREQYLNKNPKEKANLNQKGGEPVMLSNGETLFTPQETKELYKNGINPHALAPNADASTAATGDGQENGTGLWHLANGGLTPEKARLILHEGIANGHKISDKQRRFFGWKSSQGNAMGGEIEKVNGYAGGGGIGGYAYGGPVKGEKIGDATYDGQKWIDSDGNTLSQDYINKTKQAENIKQQGYDQQRVKTFQRQYDYIKNDPSRAKEASDLKNQIDKINGVNTQLPSKSGQQLNNIYKGTKPTSGLASLVNKITPDPIMSRNINPDLTPELQNPNGLASLLTPNNQDKSTYLQKQYGIDPKVADQTVNPTKTTRNNNSDNQYGIESALAGLQTAGGLSYLLNSKRPIDQVDPTFQNQVNQSIKNASYGYTPEQKALLNNQGIENRNSELANVRNLSGGNAGEALLNSRAVFNDYNQNKLKQASDDEMLRMQKQNSANNLSMAHQDKLRQLFQDRMNQFGQQQNAGASLLGAGIQNLIGAGRYNQAKQAQDQINKIDNLYLNGQ